VYAVLSGGNLSLIASLATPSTGPSGFTSAYRAIGLFSTLAASTAIDFAMGLDVTVPGVKANESVTLTQPLNAFVPTADYRNLVINGNMDFWQRGTTVSVSNAAVGRLADRWSFRPGAANGTGTMLRSTSVPTVAQSGFQSTYSLQLTAPASGGASSANSSVVLGYLMEGQDYAPIHTTTCRYSFWVRSSVTGTYYVSFLNSDSSRYYLAPYTISAANTWEKKTIDLTMDSGGTWLFDTSTGLNISHILQVGSSRQAGVVGSWQTKTGDGSPVATASQVDFWATPNATFQLAQTMLTPGSFPASANVPFERAGRTIQQELTMCQRYCPAYYFNSVSGPFGQFRTASDGSVQVPFMTTARSVPTSISLVGGGTYQATISNGTTTAVSNPTFNSSNIQGAKVDFSGGTGGSGGAACQLLNTTAGAAIIFEGSEL
jgi:hypothetical protein